MLDPRAHRASITSARVLRRAPQWFVLLSVPLLLLSLLVLSMQNWSVAQAIAPEYQVGTCGSESQTHAEIQSAVNAASPGTIINVCPGTYSESVNLSLMSEIGDITVRKVPGQGGGVLINPLVGASILITPNGIFTGNITIQEITATSNDVGIALGYPTDPRRVFGNIVISNVVAIENAIEGAALIAEGAITVLNSTFNDNDGYGLVAINNTFVIDTLVQIAVPVLSDVYIEGVTANSNGENGILVDAIENVDILNTQANNNGNQAEPGFDGTGILVETDYLLLCDDVGATDITYRVLIEDVTANGNAGWGIDIESIWDVYISDTEIISNAYDGITAFAGTGCEPGLLEVTDSVAEENGWSDFNKLDEVTAEDFYEPGGFRLASSGPLTVTTTEAYANFGFGFCLFSYESSNVHDSLAEDNFGEGFLYTDVCSLYMGRGVDGAERNVESWDIGTTDTEYPTLIISNSSAIDNDGYGGFLIDTSYSVVTLTNVSALENYIGIYVSTEGNNTFSLGESITFDEVVPLNTGTYIYDSHIQDNDEVGVLYEHPIFEAGVAGPSTYTSTNVLNRNIICENGIGLAAEIPVLPENLGAQTIPGFAFEIDARGNWWGDTSGPNAIDNPGGQGNGIEVLGNDPPTNTVDLQYVPWINTIIDSASPNPTLVGIPVDVAYQFADGTLAYYLENGVGDPNNGPLFTLSTNNGTIAGDPNKFIVNSLIEDTVTPATAGNMSITLNGPCNLDSTQNVLVATPDIEVEKSPDVQGVAAGDSAVFTITVFNTGNITLTDISVSDPLAPDCNRGDLGDLPPGEQTSYTCSHTITANLDNTATAQGFALVGGSAAGSAVTDSDTASVYVASFELTKTVFVNGYRELIGEGLFNDSDCALESAITVPLSATVKYCYALTNTGEYTLSVHSLVDSHFPTALLSNFPQEVGPGDTFTTVDAGVTVTKMLTLSPGISTTNIATWTAEIAAPIVSLDAKAVNAVIPVVANAQATVTISPDDLDQDKDGIPDNIEGTGDVDSDGIPNYLDPAGPTNEPPTDQPKQMLDIFLPSLGNNE